MKSENMQQSRLGNLEERLKQDEFYYMPEDAWPKDATDIRREPNYLWFRYSDWKMVTAVNESNKALLDKCIEHYKKKRTEIENPLNEDHFWTECVDDCIVGNAIANRDYVFDGDNNGRLKLEKLLKQYDVVIQETLGGYVCKPFLVYDIRYRNSYKASIELDEYAEKKLEPLLDEIHKMEKVIENEKKRLENDDYIHGRIADGEITPSTKQENYNRGLINDLHKQYRKKRLELIREGHANYSVEQHGTEYEMEIRWVEHTDKGKVLHKGCY